MWAFIDIGFCGGIVVLILLVAFLIKDHRKHKAAKIHGYANNKEFDKRMKEEQAKFNEYFEEFEEDWKKKHGSSWDE